MSGYSEHMGGRALHDRDDEARVAKGADVQFTWLFMTEYAAVTRTVYFILHDRDRAEDIAQDAFVQLHNHWRRVSRYERPDAWVRRVAIRLAMRTTKRERLRVVLEREAATPELPAGVDLDLLRAVGELSPMQRAVVVLYYYEDRPMADVAHILEISESTGFVHLHRARNRLGELLGEEVDDGVRRP